MIPEDPVILLSFVNTKLRDEYPNLDELCASLGENRAKLERKLTAIDTTMTHRSTSSADARKEGTR